MDEIIIRNLTLEDDLEKVGELIYYTDRYIFPYLYDTLEDAKKVHVEMIKRNTIYNYHNIKIAISSGKIVGIIIYKSSPITIIYDEMKEAFLKALIAPDERFEKVYKEYWSLLANEPEGIYVANVCVDKEYRGNGTARKLLLSILDDNNTYNLETVKANESAYHLYTSLGFEVEYEYPGFTDIPCYRMHRIKK